MDFWGTNQESSLNQDANDQALYFPHGTFSIDASIGNHQQTLNNETELARSFGWNCDKNSFVEQTKFNSSFPHATILDSSEPFSEPPRTVPQMLNPYNNPITTMKPEEMNCISIPSTTSNMPHSLSSLTRSRINVRARSRARQSPVRRRIQDLARRRATSKRSHLIEALGHLQSAREMLQPYNDFQAVICHLEESIMKLMMKDTRKARAMADLSSWEIDSAYQSTSQVSAADETESLGTSFDFNLESLSCSSKASEDSRQSTCESDHLDMTMDMETPRPTQLEATVYHCIFQKPGKSCKFSTTKKSDWIRHGKSEKHYPQKRYMCILCIESVDDEEGHPLCSFCSVPISVSTNNKQHYLQCEEARKGRHIFAGAREEHFKQHLMHKHGLEGIEAEQSTWTFDTQGDWPRECGFCGDQFSSWLDRTNHVADHFREGVDNSSWGIPFRKPKAPGDHRRPVDHQKRDDDDDTDGDDGDNHFGGGGRSLTPQSFLGSSGNLGSSQASSSGYDSQGWSSFVDDSMFEMMRRCDSKVKVEHYLEHQLMTCQPTGKNVDCQTGSWCSDSGIEPTASECKATAHNAKDNHEMPGSWISKCIKIEAEMESSRKDISELLMPGIKSKQQDIKAYDDAQDITKFPRMSLLWNEYDVVVIGSGYGGAVAASRMTRAGQSVFLLERGLEKWPDEYPTSFVDAMKQMHVSRDFAPGILKGSPVEANERNASIANGLGGTSLLNTDISMGRDNCLQILATPKSNWPELPESGLLEKQPEVLRTGKIYRPPQTTRFQGSLNCADPTAAGSSSVNNGNIASMRISHPTDTQNPGAEMFCECEVRYNKKHPDPEQGYLVLFAWHGSKRGAFKENIYEDLMWVRAKKCVFLRAGSIGTTEILTRSEKFDADISLRAKLVESEERIDTVVASSGNAEIDNVNGEHHGSLSSTNLGASNPTQKPLIDMKREEVQTPSMNEVCTNRSRDNIPQQGSPMKCLSKTIALLEGGLLPEDSCQMQETGLPLLESLRAMEIPRYISSDDAQKLSLRLKEEAGRNYFSRLKVMEDKDVDSQKRFMPHVQHDQEHEAILNWLTPIACTTQRSDYIEAPQPGTGQWFLDSIEYQTWLNNDKQTLFCSGIPGAGKTIISSIIVDNLNAKFRNDAGVGIAYIYCSYQQDISLLGRSPGWNQGEHLLNKPSHELPRPRRMGSVKTGSFSLHLNLAQDAVSQLFHRSHMVVGIHPNTFTPAQFPVSTKGSSNNLYTDADPSAPSYNSRLLAAGSLMEYMERIISLTAKFNRHLQDFDIEPALHSLSPPISETHPAIQRRIQEEINNIKKCFAICTKASKQPYLSQTNVFENISMASDGHQVIVSTLGKLIQARLITAGTRSI